MRYTWTQLVGKKGASTNGETSSGKLQQQSRFSPFQSENPVCRAPQSSRPLEPMVEVNLKVQECFSPKQEEKEGIEVVKVEAGMTMGFSDVDLIAVGDQVMPSTQADSHLELEINLFPTHLQMEIKQEQDAVEMLHGRLYEVEDEVMLDWLESKPFANRGDAEVIGVFKENFDDDPISKSVSATEMKVSLGTELASKKIDHAPEAKEKAGVKKSKGSSTKRLKEKLPSKCEECGKTFSRVSKCLLHINVVHRKIMPIKCDMGGCKAGFASKRDKEEHIRVVHNNFPFTCPMHNCAKTFTSKTNCTAHVRMVHLKHRAYVCPYPDCGVKVTRKFALEYHKRAIHGEPKLGCPVPGCGRGFNLNWRLVVHVKNDHEAAE